MVHVVLNFFKVKSDDTDSLSIHFASVALSQIQGFYTPWKRQKTQDFLTFSGGIEMKRWDKMG